MSNSKSKKPTPQIMHRATMSRKMNQTKPLIIVERTISPETLRQNAIANYKAQAAGSFSTFDPEKQRHTLRKQCAGFYAYVAQNTPGSHFSCVKYDKRHRAIPTPRLKTGDPVYQEMKKRIIEIDKVCRFCMKAPATTIDHVFPLGLGGCNHDHNLVGSCEPCNNFKNSYHPKEINFKLHLPLRFFNY